MAWCDLPVLVMFNQAYVAVLCLKYHIGKLVLLHTSAQNWSNNETWNSWWMRFDLIISISRKSSYNCRNSAWRSCNITFFCAQTRHVFFLSLEVTFFSAITPRRIDFKANFVTTYLLTIERLPYQMGELRVFGGCVLATAAVLPKMELITRNEL